MGMDSEVVTLSPISPILSIDEKMEEKRKLARDYIAAIGPRKRTKFALPREEFTPSKREHVETYRRFLDTGSWGNMQFHIEYPYQSVAETVVNKFALYATSKLLSQEST